MGDRGGEKKRDAKKKRTAQKETDVANAREDEEERERNRAGEGKRKIGAKGVRGEGRRRRREKPRRDHEEGGESVRVTSARPGPIKGPREERREGGGGLCYRRDISSFFRCCAALRLGERRGERAR